jgi:hypothetical protein
MITKFPNTISSGKIVYRYLFFSYFFLAKTYQSYTQFYNQGFSRSEFHVDCQSVVCVTSHIVSLGSS